MALQSELKENGVTQTAKEMYVILAFTDPSIVSQII